MALLVPEESAEACAACSFEFHKKKCYQSQTLLRINFWSASADANPSFTSDIIKKSRGADHPKFSREISPSWSDHKIEVVPSVLPFESVVPLIDAPHPMRPTPKRLWPHHVLERPMCRGLCKVLCLKNG